MSSTGPEGQAMDLNYRRLGTQDVAAWRALMLEGTRDFPLGFLQSAAEVQALSGERCREILGYGALRGVFRQDALLGLCGYRPQMFARMAHRVELGPFYVTRKAQGTGVADRMMAGAIAEARSEGRSLVELYVDAENHRAIAFYQRHGFRLLARLPDCVRIDGGARVDLFYRLDLSPRDGA
ncbi:GNAT family N-acetyltransferase [Ruegeria pomeroyi]|nr:GNAT family N-acetyltransferase [Ruegeria pomeroyi]